MKENLAVSMANESIEKIKNIKAHELVRPAILFVTALVATYLFSLTNQTYLQQNLYEVGTIAKKTISSPLSIKKEGFDAYFISAGEVIVRKGDRIDAEQLEKINELLKRQSLTEQVGGSFLRFLLVGLVLSLSFTFARHAWREFRPSSKDVCILSLIFLGSVGLFTIFVLAGRTLSFYYSDISETAFIYATPFAGWAILLRLTLNFPSVFVFLLSLSLIVGIFISQSVSLLFIILLGGMVGALGVKKWSRRSAFIKAGARIAMVNVILVIALALLGEELHAADLTAKIIFAGIGGFFSGVVATILSPLAEYLGSYVTDIKLLELSSLDHPLLRELSSEAPGTWNHSMIMGQLGEAAAEVIGANSLLVRVGAYYHDIGKTNKPDYFVENQKGKENRHDKLTPSMSALIIKAHVKDGVEMARKHHLPEAIIDFIPQHHGTSRIEFFYDKAQKEAEEDEKVDESHYRYPGPKPQTKETAILMLADAAESSSRTVTEPTPAKIQGLVQKIVNKAFSSGQLDESELTLKDLHLITKEFTRVLTGIHHKRIEYAEPAEKRSQKSDSDAGSTEESTEAKGHHERRNPGKTQGTAQAGEQSGEKKNKGTSPDTLKRLGI